MATFRELITRVTLLVDDDSLITSFGDFINQGVSEIAGGMPSLLDGVADPIPNSLTPPLPELFTIGTVDTSITDAFVDMPNDFQRGLQLAAAPAGNEIDIEHSFIELTETYPLLNKVGNISSCVEHGNKFYYQGIPSTSEKITLHYYRKCVTMVEDDDEPDGIPEHLHIALLVNFACWKSYEFLEDGIEGEIPNTLKFKNSFLEALRTLELTLPSYTRGMNLRSDN